MVTYEYRVSKIKTIDDVNKQLRRAKQYVQRIRREAKAMPTLALKLRKMEEQRAAETVLRKLRSNLFDLEDAIRNKQFAA